MDAIVFHHDSWAQTARRASLQFLVKTGAATIVASMGYQDKWFRLVEQKRSGLFDRPPCTPGRSLPRPCQGLAQFPAAKSPSPTNRSAVTKTAISMKAAPNHRSQRGFAKGVVE